MILPPVRDALLAAVRRVNARFYAIPESRRPEIGTPRWIELDAELNQTGDVDSALSAIERWEREVVDRLEAAR